MNSREHLAEDLDLLVKRTKQIGAVAWAVALAVMIFGTPIVFTFLTDHNIPGGVAWLLSLAADGALIVGLIATPVLAQLDVPAGWVGTLRYVAGFSTWALQTAGSWTAPGGPDGVGIAAHSFGPVLLFFAVEAASSFQRKVATALTAKTRELADAEQKDADRRAHLAETEANLRAAQAEAQALTSERENHLREIERLTAEITSAADMKDSEKDALRTSITHLEAENRDLREQMADVERSHRQELRQARAEARLPHLDDRRRHHGGGAKTTSTKTTVRARLSDEDAVQMLLDAPPDPEKKILAGHLREWSQSAIVTCLGVGWGKAPRLLEAVTEAQQRMRSDGTAVGE